MLILASENDNMAEHLAEKTAKKRQKWAQEMMDSMTQMLKIQDWTSILKSDYGQFFQCTPFYTWLKNKEK
jgi:hypothetical protein